MDANSSTSVYEAKLRSDFTHEQLLLMYQAIAQNKADSLHTLEHMYGFQKVDKKKCERITKVSTFLATLPGFKLSTFSLFLT